MENPGREGGRRWDLSDLPSGVYGIIKSGLRKHNIEEMARFSEFLPGLYRQNAK